MARSKATQDIKRGIREGPAPAARLPNTFVGLFPIVAQPIDQAHQVTPAAIADARDELVERPDAVDRFSINVELQLVRGAVTDPDRLRARVPVEVVEALFLENLSSRQRGT